MPSLVTKSLVEVDVIYALIRIIIVTDKAKIKFLMIGPSNFTLKVLERTKVTCYRCICYERQFFEILAGQRGSVVAGERN